MSIEKYNCSTCESSFDTNAAYARLYNWNKRLYHDAKKSAHCVLFAINIDNFDYLEVGLFMGVKKTW